MAFVYPLDHVQEVEAHKECRDGLMIAVGKLDDMTRDRDEWKQQHENLLAMYRAQTAELAKLRAQRRSVNP